MPKFEIPNITEIEQIKKAQKSKVEYLTFSGGGAKGAAYTGVISALEENNILANVKGIAGSSAGAITAALVATGINAQSFEKLMSNTDLQNLLGKRKIISKDGNPLYQMLVENISNNIAKYSQTNDLNQICNRRLTSLKQYEEDMIQRSMQLQEQYSKSTKQISELNSRIIDQTESSSSGSLKQELNILNDRKQALFQQIDELLKNRQKVSNQILTLNSALSNDSQIIKSLIDRAGNINRAGSIENKIYFRDLELLNIIDPATFKNLVVTATKQSDGELTIFSYTTTPDVEIALAARASASLPIVLVPVEIEGVKYVDGGYRDNTPTTYFADNSKNYQTIIDETDNLINNINSSNNKNESNKPRTIAFCFGSYDEQSPIFIAIYSLKENIYDPNAIVQFLMNVLLKAAARVGGNFQYTESVKDSLYKARDDAHNNIIISTPGIGTVSFKKAQENSEYYDVCGYLNTVTHINNHELNDIKDLNYETKQLFLKIYEDVMQINKSNNIGISVSLSPNSSNTWQNKAKNRVGMKYGEDPNNLLSFCKSKCWQEESNTYKIIEKFITVAASDYKHNKLNSETMIMSSLIKNLNDSTIPKNVKADFAHVLGINNFDINKLQFKKEDFTTIIIKNEFIPSINRNNLISR